MSKITIIGGSGFIGTCLTKVLLDRDHSVVILDKQRSEEYPELWQAADIRDIQTLRDGIPNDTEVIINLAAEHRDDVTPRSLYDEVNVLGSENVCRIADDLNIARQIFTSSVAVYGFAPKGTDEDGELNYFNDYGRTKALAERKYSAWLGTSPHKSLIIIRPTVVFGKGNRGNVYNLFRLIASRFFVMVGGGKNVKSLAYVENLAEFIAHSLQSGAGKHIYNYVDQPDFDMNRLVSVVKVALGQNGRIRLRIPYPVGIVCGFVFDVISAITRRKLPVSSIRIRKFCSDSQFSSKNMKETSFVPRISLEKAINDTIKYEFGRSGLSSKQ